MKGQTFHSIPYGSLKSYRSQSFRKTLISLQQQAYSYHYTKSILDPSNNIHHLCFISILNQNTQFLARQRVTITLKNYYFDYDFMIYMCVYIYICIYTHIHTYTHKYLENSKCTQLQREHCDLLIKRLNFSPQMSIK